MDEIYNQDKAADLVGLGKIAGTESFDEMDCKKALALFIQGRRPPGLSSMK